MRRSLRGHPRSDSAWLTGIRSRSITSDQLWWANAWANARHGDATFNARVPSLSHRSARDGHGKRDIDNMFNVRPARHCTQMAALSNWLGLGAAREAANVPKRYDRIGIEGVPIGYSGERVRS